LFVSNTTTEGNSVSYFSDALAFLDRIKFLKGLPKIVADVDDLKNRIAALEEKLGDRLPADACRFCGAKAARLAWSAPTHDGKGYQPQDWKCSECTKTDHRVVKIT
jgi:hypothetical protein